MASRALQLDVLERLGELAERQFDDDPDLALIIVGDGVLLAERPILIRLGAQELGRHA